MGLQYKIRSAPFLGVFAAGRASARSSVRLRNYDPWASLRESKVPAVQQFMSTVVPPGPAGVRGSNDVQGCPTPGNLVRDNYSNPGRSDFAAPDFTELMILLFKGRLSALSAGSVKVHCQTGTAVSSNAFDQALPMLGSCFVEAPCSTTAVRLPTWSQSSHLCLVYRPLGPDMAHIFEHQHAGLHFLHVPHDGHLRATCKGCGKANMVVMHRVPAVFVPRAHGPCQSWFSPDSERVSISHVVAMLRRQTKIRPRPTDTLASIPTPEPVDVLGSWNAPPLMLRLDRSTQGYPAINQSTSKLAQTRQPPGFIKFRLSASGQIERHPPCHGQDVLKGQPNGGRG